MGGNGGREGRRRELAEKKGGREKGRMKEGGREAPERLCIHWLLEAWK